MDNLPESTNTGAVVPDARGLEARQHAVELEQCALFVDSPPLAKAMTDAAAFIRSSFATPLATDTGTRVEKLREALLKCERRAEMQIDRCLQRADGRGLNDAKAMCSDIAAIVSAALDGTRVDAGEGFRWPEPKFVPIYSGAQLNPARVTAAFELINGELVIGEQFRLIEMLLDGTDYTVTPAIPTGEGLTSGEGYRQGQIDMRERAAMLCDQRGAEEQEAFGLVRGTQNYFRARNAIRDMPIATSPSQPTNASVREDRYANDVAAQALYDTWAEQSGWVPWVDRGNSDMQERARREVML